MQYTWIYSSLLAIKHEYSGNVPPLRCINVSLTVYAPNSTIPCFIQAQDSYAVMPSEMPISFSESSFATKSCFHEGRIPSPVTVTCSGSFCCYLVISFSWVCMLFLLVLCLMFVVSHFHWRIHWMYTVRM